MGSSRLWSVPYAMETNDIGTSLKKLVVTGETDNLEEALFEVKNRDGQTIFAAYNEGVRVFVNDGDEKGVKGGFAIGKNAIASGLNSFAFGDGAKALNDDAYAFVAMTEARGQGSFAFGYVGRDSLGNTMILQVQKPIGGVVPILPL